MARLHFVLFMIFASVVLCDTVWQEKYPNPTGSAISSMAWGYNKFLATGSDGTLLQSADGIQWIQCDSFADGDYISAEYANGFTMVTNSDNTVFYSHTGACNSEENIWTSLPFNTDYTYSGNIRISPQPVPSNWVAGFISVSNNKAYYSEDGSYGGYELLDIDYSTYKVWSVATDGEKWVLKLALTPDTITADTVYEIFTMTIDVVTLAMSTPTTTSYHSLVDNGFAFSTATNQFITASYAGIIYSTDAISWDLKNAAQDLYQFEKLVCSGNHCVGLSIGALVYDSGDAGASFNLITLENTYYIYPGFPTVSVNEANPDAAIFMIGSSFGSMYRSVAAGTWESVGSPSNSYNFNQCDQFVYNNPFIIGCEQHLLLSQDAEEWTARSYSDVIGYDLELLTTSEDSLVGVAQGNQIWYSTGDIGRDWEKKATLRLQQAHSFQLTAMNFYNSLWIGYGSDRWTIVGGDEQGQTSIVPMMVRSDDGDVWGIYSMNVIMNDVTYSKDNNEYIGAGLNGVYTSPNNFNWTRSTSSNGACSVITSDDHLNYIALCTNSASGSLSNILKVTLDGGETWSDLYSPCASTGADGESPSITCGQIEYNKNLDGFLLYSANPTGDLFFSSDGGLSWAPMIIPYALRIYGISDHDSLFVTLARDAIYHGDADDIEFGPVTRAVLYTRSTTSDVPALPAISPGFITSEPNDLIPSSFDASTFEVPSSFNPTTADVSSFRENGYEDYLNPDKSSGGGISGGGIFGIVFALIILLLIILLIVAAVLYKQKQGKGDRRREEQAKILNEENDML